MSAKVLEGPEVAASICEDLAERVCNLKSKGVNPTLAIFRVGENPDDISYEKGATKRAEGVGIAVEHVLFSSDSAEEEIVEAVRAASDDPSIHGILVLRPMPEGVDEDAVLSAIDPAKDVDAGRLSSVASVFTGEGDGFAPCTAQAVMEILDHYGVELESKNALVVGRSLVVGKPLAMMLLDRNATVTVAHSRTQDLPMLARNADVLVACVGKAQMIDGRYFSSGQTVVDVGINFTDDGKMVGDVDFDAAEAVVGAVTPVPRGVGSVTTSVLCKHVVEAAEKASF